VAFDAFGDLPVLTFPEYARNSRDSADTVVMLGNKSGGEVRIERLAMDWILARISNNELVEYVGVEVQSLDITGNYRDAWYAYQQLSQGITVPVIPKSEHGLNWANVHKRLIPQIIRKGSIYSNSPYVRKGLYFIVPDAVFKVFEEVLGDLAPTNQVDSKTLSIFTYELGPLIGDGEHRALKKMRVIRVGLDEFSQKFIAGRNLPHSSALDRAVLNALGLYSPFVR